MPPRPWISVWTRDSSSRLGTRLARLWEQMGDFLYDIPALMESAGLSVETFTEYGPGDHIRAVVGRKLRGR